jgi:hypothetical protein
MPLHFFNVRGKVVARTKRSKPELVGLLGVGLDSKDEHKRLTRADDIILVGGSQETHAKMQDVAIRLNETLKNRGKRLRDVCPEEVVELIHEAHDS